MELKPCPFCRGEVGIVRRKYGEEDTVFAVSCPDCMFSMTDDTSDGLIERWNRRASTAPEQDDRERAEAFLDAELNDMRDSADSTPVGTVSIGRLAALLAEVRAEERERAAKIAEGLYSKTYWDDPVSGIAAAIRGSR